MRANLGISPDAIIGAKLFAEISHYLQPSEPPPAAEKLMKALQGLGGDESSQRVVRDIWREIQARPLPGSTKVRPLRRREVRRSAESKPDAAAPALRPPAPGEPEIARLGGELRGKLMASGKPRTQADLLIAATARHHDHILVTRNLRDFADFGVSLLDPFATSVS